MFILLPAMSKEFTKSDLIKYLNDHAKKGNLSLDDLANLVYDSKFPDELVESGTKILAEIRDDQKQLMKVASKGKNKADTLGKIKKEITETNNRISKLNHQIQALEIPSQMKGQPLQESQLNQIRNWRQEIKELEEQVSKLYKEEEQIVSEIVELNEEFTSIVKQIDDRCKFIL